MILEHAHSHLLRDQMWMFLCVQLILIEQSHVQDQHHQSQNIHRLFIVIDLALDLPHLFGLSILAAVGEVIHTLAPHPLMRKERMTVIMGDHHPFRPSGETGLTVALHKEVGQEPVPPESILGVHIATDTVHQVMHIHLNVEAQNDILLEVGSSIPQGEQNHAHCLDHHLHLALLLPLFLNKVVLNLLDIDPLIRILLFV